jgi:hypothetical protein
MIYKLHRRPPNGLPDLLKQVLLPDVEQIGVENAQPVWSYGSAKAAAAALVAYIGHYPDFGKYEEFAIQPYDDKGNPLESVDTAESDTAAEQIRWLAANNPDVLAAITAMLTARQLYVFAAEELTHALSSVTEIAGAAQTAHPLCHELALQAIADEAYEPFEPAALLKGLSENVLSWLEKRIEKNEAARVREHNAELEARRKAYREHRVPIGITLDHGHDGRIERSLGVILVGYRPAIDYLLTHVVTTALAADDADHPNRVLSVVRFSDKMTPEGNSARLVRVPRQIWENSLASPSGFERTITEHVLPHMTASLDLLVVDNLTVLRHVGILGQHPSVCDTVNLHGSYKRLRKWTRDAVLVVGVPVPDEAPPDLSTQRWEDLREHAMLRAVTVVRPGADTTLAADRCRIEVSHADYVVDFAVEVPAAALQSPNNIIL